VPPQLAALRETPAPDAHPVPPKVPTTAELQAALLAADDVPPGLSVEPDWERRYGLSAETLDCDKVIRAMARTPDGSAGEAHVAFTIGSMDGLFAEDLAALPAPDAARQQVTAVRDATKACSELTLETEAGELPATVTEASAPDVGDERTAVRIYLDDPEVDFDITVVFIANGPVLLATSGIDVETPDFTAFTEDAFAKLTTGQVPNKEETTDSGSTGPSQPA
jgi:hypothetical protein